MAYHEISPGNAHSPSRLCPPHIRPCFPCRYRTLKIIDFSSNTTASYVIPVRQASVSESPCSRLPACGFLQPTPHDANLAVRLTLPPAGCIEDLHLQVSAPCRAQSSRRRGLPRCLSHHRAYGSVPRRFLLRVRPSGHTHFCPISTQPYLAESVRYFPALRPSFEASAQYKQQYGP